MSLRDLVIVTEDRQGFPGKTLLASPGAEIQITPRVPVAILDGPEAVRIGQKVDADTVVMLIEYSEYDETVAQEITGMVAIRDDDVVPDEIPDRLPPGIEVSVFGWRRK